MNVWFLLPFPGNVLQIKKLELVLWNISLKNFNAYGLYVKASWYYFNYTGTESN